MQCYKNITLRIDFFSINGKIKIKNGGNVHE
jgi:hypothetical protein